jgi:glutamate dehydrogenase/leucine dehydrogenase
VGFPEAESVTNELLLTIPCDILVPAAMERQITAANAGRIQSQVMHLSRKNRISPRLAALSLGIKRVHEAKQIRGLFP